MKKFKVDFTMDILNKEVEENKDIEGLCNLFDIDLCINEKTNEITGIALAVGQDSYGVFQKYITVFNACLDVKEGKQIETI